MRDTAENLIHQLAGDLQPVKRLPHPAKRLLFWLLLALPVSLALGALIEHQNMALALDRIKNPRVLLELLAILLTAATAGYAALSSAQPGRNENVWVLPVVPFLLWLSFVSETCWQLFNQVGPDQFSFAPHWVCYPAVVATGFAPALVLAIFLRQGLLRSPSKSVALAVLAASALGAIGLRLFHPPDATVLLLMWQLIATVTFMLMGSLGAKYWQNRA